MPKHGPEGNKDQNFTPIPSGDEGSKPPKTSEVYGLFAEIFGELGKNIAEDADASEKQESKKGRTVTLFERLKQMLPGKHQS